MNTDKILDKAIDDIIDAELESRSSVYERVAVRIWFMMDRDEDRMLCDSDENRVFMDLIKALDVDMCKAIKVTFEVCGPYLEDFDAPISDEFVSDLINDYISYRKALDEE